MAAQIVSASRGTASKPAVLGGQRRRSELPLPSAASVKNRADPGLRPLAALNRFKPLAGSQTKTRGLGIAQEIADLR